MALSLRVRFFNETRTVGTASPQRAAALHVSHPQTMQPPQAMPSSRNAGPARYILGTLFMVFGVVSRPLMWHRSLATSQALLAAISLF